MRLDLDGPHLGQEADRQTNGQQDQRRGDTHLERDELTHHDNEHSGQSDKKGIHALILL